MSIRVKSVLFRRIRALAHALALLCAVQISGLERGVVEALVSAGVVEIHCDDCGDDTPDDCPPGCPTCHCSGLSAIPTPVPTGELVLPRELPEAPPVTSEAHAPQEPDHLAVYRPPRALSRSGMSRYGVVVRGS